MAGSIEHVMDDAGHLERAQPVMTVNMGTYVNHSGTIANANQSQEIFPAADEAVIRRTFAHVGTSGSIWFTPFGGTPAANGPGCFELRAGDQVELDTFAQILAIGTVAGIPYTAMER